jgi:dTDP-4-amino-4,6-dideoxygalactose transaminase
MVRVPLGQMSKIPFNRPFATGAEFRYIREAIENGHLSGNGPFANRCARWLEQQTGSARVLLTHSCTGALELAAMLAGVGPGDEVVMPSFTFASTANAFVLRGVTPVFADIREDTLNLDERQLSRAVTPRTRAIVPVHYAGVGCEMDEVLVIAGNAGVPVIEDAAQGLLATYRGRELGSIGSLGALSFHETKNVISGEGGALLVNEPDQIERAEVLLEKGTDRSRFFRGEVDKYTWIDIGGSYSPSEIIAAFLWAQLEQAQEITRRRLEIWHRYNDAFSEVEQDGFLRRPVVPEDRTHNAHMYYVLLRDSWARDQFIRDLASRGVHSVFHYVPLHSSEAGRRYGRVADKLPVTEAISDRLVRLPLWVGMTDSDVEAVVDATFRAVGAVRRSTSVQA